MASQLSRFILPKERIVIIRSTLVALACVATVGGALAQQTSITTQSSTPVGVLCTSGAQQDFEVVAAGTPIAGTPNNVFLSAGLNQNVYLSATTIAYPTQAFEEGIGLNYFQRAYARGASTDVAGTSASAAAAGASHGAQALRITLTNAPGRAGRIVFSYRANLGLTGQVASSLDVGADGSAEIQTSAPLYQEIAHTMGASGSVTLLVTSECSARGTGNSADFVSCWSELWIAFRPDLTAQCTITNYGTGCGGAAAAGAETVIGGQRVITFLVSGAFPASPVLAIAGTNSFNLPLLGGCSLLTSLESAVVLQADGAGLATQSWAFPATMVGTSYHQFLPMRINTAGALELAATDALRVHCQR